MDRSAFADPGGGREGRGRDRANAEPKASKSSFSKLQILVLERYTWTENRNGAGLRYLSFVC